MNGRPKTLVLIRSVTRRGILESFRDDVSTILGNQMESYLLRERQQAHALIDLLPEAKLSAVKNLLEVMIEPLSHSLALAPDEDYDISPETALAIEQARASLARGEGISHEEILREFGLSK